MEKTTIKNQHGETIESLKKARKSNRNIPKAETKITVIMMCMDGHGVLDIKRLLKLSDKTVSKYIKTFNDGGLKMSLKYGKSSGKPCKLIEQERDLLSEIILLTPKNAGCGESVNWTSKILQEYIQKEFGEHMTTVLIQIMLHRMGFSFTRLTYTLARTDKKNL